MNRFASILFTSFVLSAASFAQTQISSIQLRASNTDFPLSGGGLVFPTLDSYVDEDGGEVSDNFSWDWSGNDRNGNWRTMEFSGAAMAQGGYGAMHTYASGSLLNSFYNENNTPFHNSQTGETDWENGVPDVISLEAYAGWTDQLQVGGTANNYYSTWIFNVNGINTGEEAFAFIRIRIGNNPSDSFYYFNPGSVNEQIRLSQYIVGGTPEDIEFELYSIFQPSTQYFDDGETITGASDFGHTVTLEGIEFRDAPGGNLITGLELESASGYQYEVVPEPASLAALGLGALALLRKRRSGA